MADVVLHYEGSIPGKVQIGAWVFNGDIIDIPGVANATDWLEWAYANGYLTISFQVLENNSWIDVEEGYQLHECYTLKLIVTIHIPQLIEVAGVMIPTDFLMNLNGSFTFDFEVVQWNEYPYTGGDCGGISGHADVMLCLDTSSSIGWNASDPPIYRTAAKAFISALLSPDDAQVGIVTFNSTVQLETTFSTNIAYLHGIVDGLTFYGNTMMPEGIDMAQIELATADRLPEITYPDYIVLITDGVPCCSGDLDPVDNAAAAKANGTIIYALGIGQQTDPVMLTQVASPGCYYGVAQWSDLEATLLSII
jgi:uncharacterized protein YegL